MNDPDWNSLHRPFWTLWLKTAAVAVPRRRRWACRWVDFRIAHCGPCDGQFRTPNSTSVHLTEIRLSPTFTSRLHRRCRGSLPLSLCLSLPLKLMLMSRRKMGVGWEVR
jgi:hypothetical protein